MNDRVSVCCARASLTSGKRSAIHTPHSTHDSKIYLVVDVVVVAQMTVQHSTKRTHMTIDDIEDARNGRITDLSEKRHGDTTTQPSGGKK